MVKSFPSCEQQQGGDRKPQFAIFSQDAPAGDWVRDVIRFLASQWMVPTSTAIETDRDCGTSNRSQAFQHFANLLWNVTGFRCCFGVDVAQRWVGTRLKQQPCASP